MDQNLMIRSCAARTFQAATMRAALTNAWNAGTDLVCYSGHGAIDQSGTEGFLTTAEATNLLNTTRWPVVLATTCVAGQFSVPGSDCLSEYLLRRQQAGAIAVIAPTGLSWDRDGAHLSPPFGDLGRSQHTGSPGDSFRQAVADHVSFDAPGMPVWIYNLLGDPGLTYTSPAALFRVRTEY